MPVIDKAVSTEDLRVKNASPALGALRLEAILNTLVENKVESLKQENGKSSSPKTILQKLNCHSSPKPTLKIEDEKKKNPKRKDRKHYKVVSESKQFKRQVLRQETSSPDSQILHGDDRSASCMESNCETHVCYCNQPGQVTDDYISIKMDAFGDIETDAIIAQEEMRRARRKRRRKRKKRLKKRLALNPHLVETLTQDSDFKALSDDELPPRAKWTIVATACLLLFMCLLLVGITLRMAPIIDEIAHYSFITLQANMCSKSDAFPKFPQEKHCLNSTFRNSDFCGNMKEKLYKRSKSLEEIYQKRRQRRRTNEQRRKSEFYIRDNEIVFNRKSSSRRLKRKCSRHRPSSKESYNNDIEIGSVRRERTYSYSGSTNSARKLSNFQLSEEYFARRKRKKTILNVILAVYLFLFCLSILSVVITLTHTSTAVVSDRNFTRNVTYYTFAP